MGNINQEYNENQNNIQAPPRSTMFQIEKNDINLPQIISITN